MFLNRFFTPKHLSPRKRINYRDLAWKWEYRPRGPIWHVSHSMPKQVLSERTNKDTKRGRVCIPSNWLRSRLWVVSSTVENSVGQSRPRPPSANAKYTPKSRWAHNVVSRRFIKLALAIFQDSLVQRHKIHFWNQWTFETFWEPHLAALAKLTELIQNKCIVKTWRNGRNQESGGQLLTLKLMSLGICQEFIILVVSDIYCIIRRSGDMAGYWLAFLRSMYLIFKCKYIITRYWSSHACSQSSINDSTICEFGRSSSSCCTGPWLAPGDELFTSTTLIWSARLWVIIS